MAYVPEVVLDIYHGIPPKCFVLAVPSDLAGYEDNEVVPYTSPLVSPNGEAAKWLRYCDYLPFGDACEKYWMEGSEHPLKVCVMPYTPLRDAFHLHEMVEDAVSLDVDEDLVIDHAPQVKHGVVDVGNGNTVQFILTNYTLLWFKARWYQQLSHVSNELHDSQRRLDALANLLNAIPQRMTAAQLNQALDSARRRLVLSLMEGNDHFDVADVDLHDAILGIFPDAHTEVYPESCYHCLPHHPVDHIDDDATRTNLEAVKQRLRTEEGDMNDPLSIRMAGHMLLNAEGSLEFETYKENACSRFFSSRDLITIAMKPTLDYVREATTSHSLMGVSVLFEAADDGEAADEDAGC